ncbi:MAG: response regulator [Planctomycetia bacterium]|nr:response regulator [Planctomycetia bacterium]
MTESDNDVSIVMFDDEPERKSRADLLKDTTGYIVHFVDLQGKDVLHEVNTAIGQFPEPQLILIDHILSRASKESRIQHGTSIVPMLREGWPHPPIIAVTAAADVCCKNIDSDVYESIFAIESFSDLVEYVPAIITGYGEVRSEVHNLNDLTRLLGVPQSDVQLVQSSLPVVLKRSLGESDVAHHIFRWFTRTFYRNPGFLLNRRWAAVSIGVAEEHFGAYEAGIEPALYQGVFSDLKNPRWWKAKLYATLLPQSPRRFTTALQEAAKAKLLVPDEHASKCYNCGEKWPEVLGYVDEYALHEPEAVPLHLRCSRTHSHSTPEPYYEESRVMLEG